MKIHDSISYAGLVIFHYAGERYKYYGYPLRQAVQRFRRDNNLKRKHIDFIRI